MLGNILPPYHSLQELNLDWILTKVRDMLRFLPDDGTVGQILRRTAHGAEWSNEQGGGGGAVNSVNGQTGDVVLTAGDVGALPDSTVIPENTSDLVNDSGFVDAAGAAAAAPVQSVAGKTGTVTLVKGDVGLGNVDNVQQYSASNPPPYPVTSVNSQTGDVVISIPTANDYVIETGTSGSWFYRKWNSGTMEAWFVDDVLFPAPQQGPFNGFYRHVTTINILSGFTSILMTLAQGQNSCMFIAQGVSTTSDCTLYLLHAVSNTANITVADLSVYVVGKWN